MGFCDRAFLPSNIALIFKVGFDLLPNLATVSGDQISRDIVAAEFRSPKQLIEALSIQTDRGSLPFRVFDLLLLGLDLVPSLAADQAGAIGFPTQPKIDVILTKQQTVFSAAG